MESGNPKKIIIDGIYGCFERAFRDKFCDCTKHLKEYTVYKETGEEIDVCAYCAAWWRKIDPTVTMVLI